MLALLLTTGIVARKPAFSSLLGEQAESAFAGLKRLKRRFLASLFKAYKFLRLLVFSLSARESKYVCQPRFEKFFR